MMPRNRTITQNGADSVPAASRVAVDSSNRTGLPGAHLCRGGSASSAGAGLLA